MLGLKDLIIIPAQGEEKVSMDLPPEDIVQELALHKAKEVSGKCTASDIIIAADTIVWHNGRAYGKPHNEAEAFDMLKSLSGDDHDVYTGVAVLQGSSLLLEAEHSIVRFRPLSDEETAAYIRTGEPMDKAGAYGIQGRASLFVEKINGDYFNVVGLPLCRLGLMLNKLGVNLL